MQSDNLKKVLILGGLLSATCTVGAIVCVTRFVGRYLKDLETVCKINVRR